MSGVGQRDPRSSGSQAQKRASLTYQAPKQPKDQKGASNADTLFIAETGCLAYRYNKSDKKYESMGKTGAAVLGNLQTQNFHLLVYKKANEPVVKVPINFDFKFTIQNEVYASFTDTSRVTWSVKFSSADVITKFATQVAISKVLGDGLSRVVVQEIADGSGQAIEKGDEVRIKYAGNLVTEGKQGAQFDSNMSGDKTFQFTVGAGKVVKGMDDGVVGMKKKGTRVVVIPPQFAYKDKAMGEAIPANSTLVFLIKLDRVKYSSKEQQAQPQKEEEPVEEEETESDKKREEVLKRAQKMSEIAAEEPNPQAQAQGNPYGNQQGPPGYNGPPGPYGPYGQYPPPGGYPGYGGFPGQMPPYGYPQQYGQYPPNPYGPPQPQQPPAQSSELALVNSSMQALMEQHKEQQSELKRQIEEQKKALEEAQRALTVQRTAPPPEEVPVAVPQEVQQKEERANLMVSLAQNQRFLKDSTRLRNDVKTTVTGAAKKVENLHSSIENSIFGRSKKSAGGAHGLAIVQTIQKYIEDNEQLQEEVNLKSDRIDELREKLAVLLEKNKELIEQQTRTMEERNNNLSYTSDKTRQQINGLRDEKAKLEEEIHQNTDALGKDKRALTQATIQNKELLNEIDDAAAELEELREQVNTNRSDSAMDTEKLKKLQSELKEERARKKTIRARMVAIQDEMQEIETDLTKSKSLFESRKKKWLQAKAIIEKEYEEEKLEFVKRAKLQSDKFKAEKERALQEASTIEQETEEKWQNNIQKVKEQFKVRVDQLREDLQNAKEAEIQEQVERIEQRTEKLQQRAEQAIQVAEEKGRIRGFAVKTPIDSQAHARKLEEKLTQFHEQSQAFMTKHIKNTMQQFYFAMRESLDAEETYGGQDILAAVLDTIKETTYEALRSLDSDFAMDEVLKSDSDDAHTENLDATDLGLDESVMARDIQVLCHENQIHEKAVVLPPKPEEEVVEEEEVEEEVPEESQPEPEPVEEEEEPEPEAQPQPSRAAPPALEEEEEEEVVEEQEEEEEEVVEEEEEEDTEYVPEPEEEEEEEEILEEEEEVEVQDAEVDDVVESEDQGEEEEIEEKKEKPAFDPLSATSPEASPVSTPPTRRRPTSLFGEDQEDDLFSSSSSTKKESSPAPTPAKSTSTSQEEDPLISKFSTTSRPKVDLFGSDDDFFSSAASSSSQKRGVSNLDNIFGGSPSGGSTPKKNLFDW